MYRKRCGALHVTEESANPTVRTPPPPTPSHPSTPFSLSTIAVCVRRHGPPTHSHRVYSEPSNLQEKPQLTHKNNRRAHHSIRTRYAMILHINSSTIPPTALAVRDDSREDQTTASTRCPSPGRSTRRLRLLELLRIRERGQVSTLVLRPPARMAKRAKTQDHFTPHSTNKKRETLLHTRGIISALEPRKPWKGLPHYMPNIQVCPSCHVEGAAGGGGLEQPRHRPDPAGQEGSSLTRDVL